MNSTVKTIMFWAFIVICLVLLFGVVEKSAVMSGKEQDIPFSTYMEKVQQGLVSDVSVQGMEVHGHLKGDGPGRTARNPEGPAQTADQLQRVVDLRVRKLRCRRRLTNVLPAIPRGLMSAGGAWPEHRSRVL